MLSDARPTSAQYQDKGLDGNYSDDFDDKSINGTENEEAAKNVSGSTSLSSGQHSPRNISRHSSEHNYPKENSHHSSRHSSRHSSEHNYPKENSHHSSRHSSRHSSEHNYPKEDSHHSSRQSSIQRYPEKDIVIPGVRNERKIIQHSSRRSSSSSSSKSSVSGIEKKSESSHNSTADRVFHAIQSLKSKEPKRDGSKVNRKPSRRAKRREVKSPDPVSIASAECAATSPISKVPIPTTKEELLELLMHNDDLQMQLFEVQYPDRYPSHSRHVDTSRISSNSTTTGLQRQRKMVENFQHSMRREVKRRNLRDERTFLISQRNQLRMSIARFKKLSRYDTLIESCRNDITRLAGEKRMLSLDIRHNERVLVTNEERQDTNNANKRLVDEIRADDVLTRRALDRARRDALETTKMCNTKRQQISELEEKLAAAENAQSNQLDGNISELYMQKMKQLEKIHRMRQRLRLLKSGASETETEENAHLQDEREFLRESVSRMEKEVNDLLERQKKRIILCDVIDIPSSIPLLPIKDRCGSSANNAKLRSGEPSGAPNPRKHDSSDVLMSSAKKAVEEHREQQQEQKQQQNQYPWEGDAVSPGALSRDSDRKPSEPVSKGGIFTPDSTHEYPYEDDKTKFPTTASEEYPKRRRSSDGTQQGCRLSPDALKNEIKPPRCEWDEDSSVKSVEDELDYTENRDSYASINVEAVQAAAVEAAPAAPNEESSVPSWIDNNEEKPLTPPTPPTPEETVTQAVKEEISRDEVIDEAHDDIEDDIVSAKEEEEEEKEKEESVEGDDTAVYEKEENDSGVNAESADVQKESGDGEGGPSWLDFD